MCLQSGADQYPAAFFNMTYCEMPIENVTFHFNETETPQEPDWEEDGMWVAVGERVYFAIEKDSGHPVNYYVDWYGGQTSTDDTTPYELYDTESKFG